MLATGVAVFADQASYVEGETAYFTFQLSQPAPQPFAVEYEISGGPAGPEAVTLHFSQGATSANVPIETTDNETPNDGYVLTVEITKSPEKGGRKQQIAKTQIVDDDGPLGPGGFETLDGETGGGGGGGATGAQVSIDATSPLAKEVGEVPGEFTFLRSGNMDGALTVYFTIAGTASNGIDYDTLQTSFTIPAYAATASMPVTPVMDTDLEGIETVVITISAHASYTLGEYTSAQVDIRDRAGVKQILATANVTEIPPEGPGRDVTGSELELTQDDTVPFKAIPTDGGDFAPNEPEWAVTGESSSTGTTRTVTFDTFRTSTFVVAATPVDEGKQVAIKIVPYPTGITGTVPLGNIVLPGSYGTIFEHTLTASTGATGNHLYKFNRDGLLEHREFVTYDPPFEEDGPRDRNFPIAAGGFLQDQIYTNTASIFHLNQWSIPTSGGSPMVSPQDFLWRSTAADSLNTGWHEYVSNNDIRVTLQTKVADGYTVTTTDNVTTTGSPASFVQPHYAPGPAAHLVGLWPHPEPIPLGGTVELRLTGTVKLTAADILAGNKTFQVEIYDDDPIFNVKLQSVAITVPAGNGVPDMYTPFYMVTTLSNVNHEVVGTAGSSGESDPWIFLYIPDGDTYSSSIQVFAE